MSDFDATMAALRERFVARCMTDCARLKAHLEGDILAPPELRRAVHRLAGAAGMFGYAELGAVAGDLDAKLAASNDPSGLPRLIEALAALNAPRP